MKRIYAEPDDQLMERIVQEANTRGITRHKLVLEAIDSFLYKNGSELDSLRKELDSLLSERDSLKIELDKKWAEISQLRSEIDSQKEVIDSQTINIDSLVSERDSAKIESDSLRNEMKHFNDTMKLKDDEIAFLRSHVHQLSEKLPKALPEFTEEERKKRWWHFW